MKICKKDSPHYVNNWPRRVQCGHYLKLRCGKIAKEKVCAICAHYVKIHEIVDKKFHWKSCLLKQNITNASYDMHFFTTVQSDRMSNFSTNVVRTYFEAKFEISLLHFLHCCKSLFWRKNILSFAINADELLVYEKRKMANFLILAHEVIFQKAFKVASSQSL